MKANKKKSSVVMVKFDSARKAKKFTKQLKKLAPNVQYGEYKLPKWWEIEVI